MTMRQEIVFSNHHEIADKDNAKSRQQIYCYLATKLNKRCPDEPPKFGFKAVKALDIDTNRITPRTAEADPMNTTNSMVTPPTSNAAPPSSVATTPQNNPTEALEFGNTPNQNPQPAEPKPKKSEILRQRQQSYFHSKEAFNLFMPAGSPSDIEDCDDVEKAVLPQSILVLKRARKQIIGLLWRMGRRTTIQFHGTTGWQWEVRLLIKMASQKRFAKNPHMVQIKKIVTLLLYAAVVSYESTYLSREHPQGPTVYTM